MTEKRRRRKRTWLPSELADKAMSFSAWSSAVKLAIDENVTRIFAELRDLRRRNRELAGGVLDAIDAKDGDTALRILLALKCDRKRLEGDHYL